MIHETTYPMARQVVIIQSGFLTGSEYIVEDWWDRVSGESWSVSAAKGNAGCLDYLIHSVQNSLPNDDEVVYGKVSGYGRLIHVSELEAE